VLCLANIKERFKSGLKSAGSRLGDAAFGSPSERRINAEVREYREDRRKTAYNNAFEEGRLQETRKRGREAGRRSARYGSGVGGFLMAGVDSLDSGLHAANSVIGGFEVARPKHKNQNVKASSKKKRRKRVDKNYGFNDDDPYMVF